MAYDPAHFVIAVESIRPVKSMTDFLASDHGEGPYISAWYPTEITQPTQEEIESVDTDALLASMPIVPTADEEAARANQRLDAGVTAAVESLPLESGVRAWPMSDVLMPACSVYSSAAQSIPANTPTRIDFDTVEFDVTSAFDIDNNKFQPNVAGYYEVNCGCGVEAGAVQNFTSIYKNGVEYRRSTTSSEGGNTRLSTLVHLNGTTDYVEGFVMMNKAFNTIPGGVLTSFSCSLVQPEAPYATKAQLDEVSNVVKAMLEAHAEAQQKQ